MNIHLNQIIELFIVELLQNKITKNIQYFHINMFAVM